MDKQKNKNKKNLWIGLIAIVLLVFFIIYFFFFSEWAEQNKIEKEFEHNCLEETAKGICESKNSTLYFVDYYDNYYFDLKCRVIESNDPHYYDYDAPEVKFVFTEEEREKCIFKLQEAKD